MARPKGWAKVDSKIFELGLGQSAVLCYIGLLLHRNRETAVAFPSRATLMRYAGVRSVRQVTRLIEQLTICNVVRVVAWKKGDRNCSNRYYFTKPTEWVALDGRDGDVSTSRDTDVSTPQDMDVSTGSDTGVSTSKTDHLQKVVENVPLTRGEQEQVEPLAPVGAKKRHRKVEPKTGKANGDTDAGQTECSRTKSDVDEGYAGEGCQEGSSNAGSSSRVRPAARNGKREPNTVSADGANGLTPYRLRSKNRPRADLDRYIALCPGVTRADLFPEEA